MYQCDYQEHVQCEKKTCFQCGWNPEVAKARLEAIIAKMMGQEENEE
jgi:hypothetical protein